MSLYWWARGGGRTGSGCGSNRKELNLNNLPVCVSSIIQIPIAPKGVGICVFLSADCCPCLLAYFHGIMAKESNWKEHGREFNAEFCMYICIIGRCLGLISALASLSHHYSFERRTKLPRNFELSRHLDRFLSATVIVAVLRPLWDEIRAQFAAEWPGISFPSDNNKRITGPLTIIDHLVCLFPPCYSLISGVHVICIFLFIHG